jgi:hypothetical protein
MAKQLPVPPNRRIGGTQSQFGCFGEEINLLSLKLFGLVIQSVS